MNPPPPSEFQQRKTKTPQPLWKSLFSRRKISKVKNNAVLWLRNGFHLILSSSLELEKGKLPTKQPKLQNIIILLIPFIK